MALYVPVEAVRYEKLDDLSLVFHRLSGETHILSPEMEAIYEAIPAGGADAEQILFRLEAVHGLVEAEEGDPASALCLRLDQLTELGIVRHIS
jgi:PqqD family protein of HPr-rel-A system|tara:strand:+ start:19501 stop:19779 length:279 start_codon:yes stop_codon:yes gene_type:complete